MINSWPDQKREQDISASWCRLSVCLRIEKCHQIASSIYKNVIYKYVFCFLCFKYGSVKFKIEVIANCFQPALFSRWSDNALKQWGLLFTKGRPWAPQPSGELTVVATCSAGGTVLQFVCVTLISDCATFTLLIQHLNAPLSLYLSVCGNMRASLSLGNVAI